MNSWEASAFRSYCSMKKNIIFFVCLALLSGCAPYKVVRGDKPSDNKVGYVVARDGVVVPEYTVGENGTIPDDVYLAKERFKRRRRTVEGYYKKMGIIENRFRENVPDRLGYTLGIMGSVFTLPVRTYKSYRYAYDPKYKERVDKAKAQQEALEQARLEKLQAELKDYIRRDLEQEKAAQAASNKS